MSGYPLSQEADSDIEGIVEYTPKKWGEAQVKKYIGGLIACCKDIAMKGHIRWDASKFASNLSRLNY